MHIWAPFEGIHSDTERERENLCLLFTFSKRNFAFATRSEELKQIAPLREHRRATQFIYKLYEWRPRGG